MFFSLPTLRPDTPEQAEVRFMEAPAGVPPAVATVWWIGEKSGRELIYPKDQAMRIAKATNQSVLTTTASTTKTDEAKTGDLTRVSPSGQDTQIAENAAPADPVGRSQRGSDDAAAPVRVAQNDAPVGTAGRTPVREALPRTASTAPLMLLLGIGFLCGAAAIRFWRMRLE
jgi:hypothetical protein